MEDWFVLYIYILSVVLSIVIFYFIIQSATKSKKQVELQEETVRLLKIIVNSNSQSKIDNFNSKDIMLKVISYNIENDIATVNVKDAFFYRDKFDKDTINRIDKSKAAEYELMQIKFSDMQQAFINVK